MTTVTSGRVPCEEGKRPFLLRFRTGVVVILVAFATCAAISAAMVYTLPPWTLGARPVQPVILATAILIVCAIIILGRISEYGDLRVGEEWTRREYGGTSTILSTEWRSGKAKDLFTMTIAHWWWKWCRVAMLSGVGCSLFFVGPVLTYYKFF